MDFLAQNQNLTLSLPRSIMCALSILKLAAIFFLISAKLLEDSVCRNIVWFLLFILIYIDIFSMEVRKFAEVLSAKKDIGGGGNSWTTNCEADDIFSASLSNESTRSRIITLPVTVYSLLSMCTQCMYSLVYVQISKFLNGMIQTHHCLGVGSRGSGFRCGVKLDNLGIKFEIEWLAILRIVDSSTNPETGKCLSSKWRAIKLVTTCRPVPWHLWIVRTAYFLIKKSLHQATWSTSIFLLSSRKAIKLP